MGRPFSFMAIFYILYSEALDRFYIGHTTMTIEERLRRHLANHTGWTGRAKDWRVVHLKVFPDKEAAVKREREVKNWKKRSRIMELIETGAPKDNGI